MNRERKMKSLIAFPPIVVLSVLLPTTTFGQVKWEKSFDAAKRTATRSRKLMLVDFQASWCGPCQKMAAETFTDPQVKSLMQRMACVRLDVDQQPPQALYYGVNSIPRLLVLRPDGGNPLLDLQGFYEAKEFARELRHALGLKSSPVVPRSQEDRVLAQVRSAIQGERYAAFKAAHPKIAEAGLDQLVRSLGVFQETDLAPTTALLHKAGSDAIPALLRGMSHQHLAVRTGSYRTLQAILREKNRLGYPGFDPWAPNKSRQAQVERWWHWWKGRS